VVVPEGGRPPGRVPIQVDPAVSIDEARAPGLDDHAVLRLVAVSTHFGVWMPDPPLVGGDDARAIHAAQT